MKLCRFELVDQSGPARTGLFYEGRVYETDGVKAIGIYELGRVRFLTPIGTPSAVRAFSREDRFLYLNPTALQPPDAEVDLPNEEGRWTVEARVGALIRDRGRHVEIDEVPEFILGFTLFLGLVADDEPDELRRRDYPATMGPFLCTPDDVPRETAAEGQASQLKVEAVLSLNDEEVGRSLSHVRFAEKVAYASSTLALAAGDVILSEPLPLNGFADLGSARGLRPGDRVVLSVEGLGALALRISD